MLHPGLASQAHVPGASTRGTSRSYPEYQRPV
jgi:hypothetical protein